MPLFRKCKPHKLPLKITLPDKTTVFQTADAMTEVTYSTRIPLGSLFRACYQ